MCSNVSPLPHTEERKKAKLNYQESLQNVATVRQQAAVSHLRSCRVSTPAMHTSACTFAVEMLHSVAPVEKQSSVLKKDKRFFAILKKTVIQE